MRSSFLIIHNPQAGWHSAGLLRATTDRLIATGAEVTLIASKARGEGAMRAAQAAGEQRYDAIAAAGGDGTVRDVASGLLGAGMPLGIIPAGTGNVFAREIGMSFSGGEIAETLSTGPAGEIPMGTVNGAPFLFMVGVGFDAAAVRHFEERGTRAGGRAAYLLPILSALSNAPQPHLTVTIDGKAHQARWAIVTRARHYAGNFILAPDADISARQFQTVLFRSAHPLSLARHLGALALGLLPHDPDVTIAPASHVRIEGTGPAPVHVDGEIEGSLPLDIGFHGKPLTLIRPE